MSLKFDYNTETFQFVKENSALAHSQFFLARDWSKSLPRLHKARVEVTRIKPVMTWILTPPLQTQAAKPEAVGPMKPLQGPIQIAGEECPDSLKRALLSIRASSGRTHRDRLEKLLGGHLLGDHGRESPPPNGVKEAPLRLNPAYRPRSRPRARQAG